MFLLGEFTREQNVTRKAQVEHAHARRLRKRAEIRAAAQRMRESSPRYSQILAGWEAAEKERPAKQARRREKLAQKAVKREKKLAKLRDRER